MGRANFRWRYALATFLCMGLSGRFTAVAANGGYTLRTLPISSSSSAVLDSINNNGQVCGTRYLPGTIPQAFLLTGSTLVDLTPPGISGSPWAYGLTSTGQVLVSAAGQVSVYDNGQFTSKGDWGTPYSGGFAISDNGWIVGAKHSGATGRVPAAFLNGVVTPLSSTQGLFNAVNSSGQMAGFNESGLGEAWVRDAGGIFHMLGTMDADYSQALDINESGDVVFIARYATSQQNPRSFIYHLSDGTTTAISNSITGRYFQAGAINAAGVIVGDLYDGNNQHVGIGLYADGVLNDITRQLDPAGTMAYYDAADINDRGEILFKASHAGWGYYVATPVPEPGSAAMLVVGCAALMGRRRGARKRT
ncbi:MAG: PEP-CTERM sorting domain-containing protein [Tepidisphaerales bacterium]